MRIDEQALAEIRARLATTTPGPWEVGDGLSGVHPGQEVCAGLSPAGDLTLSVALCRNAISIEQRRADAAFIAHAPEDVRDLLAIAEAALPILRAVAGLVSDDYCAWEDKHAVMRAVQHVPDCPGTLARRALAGEAAESAEQESAEGSEQP